jgi:hypothetical protein
MVNSDDHFLLAALCLKNLSANTASIEEIGVAYNGSKAYGVILAALVTRLKEVFNDCETKTASES